MTVPAVSADLAERWHSEDLAERWRGPGLRPRAVKARKRHRCDTCRAVIEPGQVYYRHALPPGSDIGNETWWVHRTCGVYTSDCPDYWTIDRIAAKDETLVEFE